MTSRYIYLGEDWETEDLNSLGLGPVYLAGPRNPQGKSWRCELISKIEKSGVSLSYLIPETRAQLEVTGLYRYPNDEEAVKWQQTSMGCATAILFWFPAEAFDPKSLVDFGCWAKCERVFLGGDQSNNLEYLDRVFYSEQKMHAVNTLDQLAERFVHWIVS